LPVISSSAVVKRLSKWIDSNWIELYFASFIWYIWIMFCLFPNVTYSFVRHLYFSVYYILSCTVVLVLGCNWPCLAVVKHLNKWNELLLLLLVVVVEERCIYEIA
jgi:hypothetical protein